jgi:hypothetical protein
LASLAITKERPKNWAIPFSKGLLERLSENTFFDAFLENFVRKKSENFLKN